MFINVASTLIFGWKWKLSRRSFIDVVSALAKQRWNNIYRITSNQRRWTNIVSMLKFGWKRKLSQRIFIDVVSTLQNNVDTTLKELRGFNVDNPMLFQRWYLVKDEIALQMFTRKWLKYETRLSKFSSIKHTFLLYKNRVKLLFYL